MWDVVVCVEVEVDVVLVLVVRVDGGVEVELELWLVEEDAVVVVGGSVELGMFVSELELGLGSEGVVVGSVEDVVVVLDPVFVGSAVVEVSPLLEDDEDEEVEVEEVKMGTGTETEPGSVGRVPLLSRLASFTRLAMVSCSSCRASAAMMSVRKMPSRNLADRAWRAS